MSNKLRALKLIDQIVRGQERDRNRTPVPLPTLSPENQKQDDTRNPLQNGTNRQTTPRPQTQQQGHQGNLHQNGSNRQTTPRPQNQHQGNQGNSNQNNLSQNRQPLVALYYYSRLTYQQKETQQFTTCVSGSCQHQETGSDYEMNSLASGNTDRFSRRHF
ncbi:uncharacterized protein LOC110185922 [Drosophila serrata]|uniref:uncharacterized protein LOC110185922 n=1 Tax=Drosophila serrata TaxID=7274 RepID=UPI000A1D2103|nr:uncharacterized protein LOC110185922 [Drosophila serrata]